MSKDLVIVIEDDSRLRAALEVLVEYWGYRCLVARTPREALAAAGSRIRDVCAIIADIEVDAMVRADRSARVFAEAAGQTVPTLLTTTDASLIEHDGGVAVLTKPFDPEMVRVWLAENADPRDQGDERARA